jgi:ADP-ribosylglycohydrolase
MREEAKAMVLASFAADSLALGLHWNYDVEEIGRKFGRVDRLMPPAGNSYHPTKELGDFTHYGDQTLALLESVAFGGHFDLDDFALRWKRLFSGYRGYFDHATKAALEQFSQGKGPTESGSTSTDLAGAARIAPLAYRYMDDQKSLVAAAKAQTIMTHNNPAVIQDAEFLSRVLWKVLHGARPTAAMEEVRDECFPGSPLAAAVTEGIKSAAKPTRTAILKFGQSCDTRGALPSMVHLVARHENDLKEALVENVMAGGDSAARGMAVGAILGAFLGKDAIPADWLSGMKRTGTIQELLVRIDGAAV